MAMKRTQINNPTSALVQNCKFKAKLKIMVKVTATVYTGFYELQKAADKCMRLM